MTTVHDVTDNSLTIRVATPTDGTALIRLAQLDSAAPLDATPALVAEIDRELVAALPLEGGRAIANPFRHTAGIVALLHARAAELTGTSQPAPRRRRLLGSLRIPVTSRA